MARRVSRAAEGGGREHHFGQVGAELVPAVLAADAVALHLRVLGRRVRLIDAVILLAGARSFRLLGVPEVELQVGEGGRLYGSISSKDVGDALEEQVRIVVDRRRIDLEEPIRTLGTHQVAVRVATDLHPKVTVVVQEA